MLPVQTPLLGLCYKLIFSTPLPDYPKHLSLVIDVSSQGIDSLKKIHLLIASPDTWTGIIPKMWPYSKVPPLIHGDLELRIMNSYFIELEENIWNQRTGNIDFNTCMGDINEKCASIFDPRPIKYKNL